MAIRSWLRKWFGARALLWHVLLVLVVSGCTYAAYWQWTRALGGNTLSYAYGVEWPVFAVIATIGWWQLIQEDPAEVEARKRERWRRSQPKPLHYDREVLRQELFAHPELAKAIPDLGKVFPELGVGAGAADTTGVSSGALEVAADAGLTATDEDTAAAEGEEAVVAAPSRRLQQYNQALAALATAEHSRTRRPRGR